MMINSNILTILKNDLKLSYLCTHILNTYYMTINFLYMSYFYLLVLVLNSLYIWFLKGFG